MSDVRIEGLSKAFGDQRAVDAIDFEVASGELCVLLGPSGCGKSTTLRLVAGLEEPSDGRILVDGVDVAHKAPKDRRISMVFQSYALFPHLSVAKNIVFGLEVRGVAKAVRAERLARVAAMTGLAPYLDRKPSQLSGGQRQRVALARAIAGEQPICLMDEPLSNLDAKLRAEMRLEIRALQQRLGMTMLYVTHDQIEAMTMADRVVLMNEGRIEQQGAPAELYERPATTFAARFIGAPAMNLVPLETSAGPVLAGVRAEHVELVEVGAGRVAGRVKALEYHGADTVVAVDTEHGGDFAVRRPGRVRAAVGETVALAWNPTHEHRFDPTTGRRLGAIASSPSNSEPVRS
ncbi:ABC transporter ATP-binding protein [Pinisolibacter sp.]|uniref:ABC transporter ATP-binding protein n=1 Tax=Pinisolibacter sp. TaxID=2172024 RepID=UPI002FDEDAA5